MEERTDDIIERYFRNELTGAERQEVEARTDSDPHFREEVELHRKALQAIRLREKEVILAKLSERGRQLDAQAKPAFFRKWGLGGAALVLAVLIGWTWGGGENNSQKPASTPVPATDSKTLLPQPDTSAPERTDTNPAENQPETTPPIVASKQRREQLFAQYFQPYKDETLEPTARGGDELSASQRFALLYWEGQYEAALEQFNKLLDMAQKNDNQLVIKAECLLAIGRAEEAAVLFTQLKANGKTRFAEVVDWHLALALLKSGKMEQAKEALRGAVASTSSPWQVKATSLLERL